MSVGFASLGGRYMPKCLGCYQCFILALIFTVLLTVLWEFTIFVLLLLPVYDDFVKVIECLGKKIIRHSTLETMTSKSFLGKNYFFMLEMVSNIC